MGATAGAFAAAATTPLDVIKTNMMCTAASRPTMMSSARAVAAQGGPIHFFRCGCCFSQEQGAVIHRSHGAAAQTLLCDKQRGWELHRPLLLERVRSISAL